MSALDNRVPPPLVALAVAAAMAGGSYALAPSPIPGSWRAGAAAALFLAAAYFGPRAIRAFGRAGTTIDPVHVDRAATLVTTGVFARTRNPMYVSMALLLLALAAWLGQAVQVLGPLVFAAFITRFQILPEERALSTRFGPAYLDYRRAVRRWL